MAEDFPISAGSVFPLDLAECRRRFLDGLTFLAFGEGFGELGRLPCNWLSLAWKLKSMFAFALAWAQLVHRLAGRGAFPGGIFWFDAENPDLKTTWGTT